MALSAIYEVPIWTPLAPSSVSPPCWRNIGAFKDTWMTLQEKEVESSKKKEQCHSSDGNAKKGYLIDNPYRTSFPILGRVEARAPLTVCELIAPVKSLSTSLFDRFDDSLEPLSGRASDICAHSYEPSRPTGVWLAELICDRQHTLLMMMMGFWFRTGIGRFMIFN